MKEIVTQIFKDIEKCFGSSLKPNFHNLYATLQLGCDKTIISFLTDRFWVHTDTDLNVDKAHVIFLMTDDDNARRYKLMLSGVGRYICLLPVEKDFDGTQLVGPAMSLDGINADKSINALRLLIEKYGLVLVEDNILDQDLIFDGEVCTIYDVLFSEC